MLSEVESFTYNSNEMLIWNIMQLSKLMTVEVKWSNMERRL